MVADILWLPQAEKDILDIYVTIGVQQPKAAEDLFERMEAKIGMLSHHPRMGRRRPDIAARLRMLVDSPYLILYRLVPDDDHAVVTGVEIVRILDGRRELDKFAGD